MLGWTPKAPTDQLDFALDPTAWLASSNDALVDAYPVLPAPAGPSDLVALWWSIIDGMAVVMLAGGQPATTVPILIVLMTQQGRRHTEIVNVVINAATSAAPVATGVAVLPNGAPIPPNAIVLPNGKILTNDAGQPILIA